MPHNAAFYQGLQCLLRQNGYSEKEIREQKFYSSAHNYEQNLERTSNSSKSTRLVGRVLWDELLGKVILHITPLCSLLHTLLKDKRMCLQEE